MDVRSVQNNFIDDLRKRKVKVCVYINGGVRLDGFISEVDDISLVLSTRANNLLVYKNSICSILEDK